MQRARSKTDGEKRFTDYSHSATYSSEITYWLQKHQILVFKDDKKSKNKQTQGKLRILK